MPPDPEPQLAEGDVLAGRYRLVRPLGEGGMGFVWEALQLTTDKPVAIKVLKSQAGADTARFLREAKVAAALSHRNIVQVFDFWEVSGNGPVFMVMELLHGETLAELIERAGRLPLEHTLALVLPVASAVRAAHARGVVHRDLKPDNVFLARVADAPGPEVKVVDFGLAKPFIANMATTALTQTGSVMGTPYYMSPEQVYGEKDIDGQADVWALGVILYECLSGVKPFEGENFGQIFRKVTHGLYRPLREAAPDVPLAVDALVGRALSHDRAQRPTAAELHDTLAGMRASESLPPPAQMGRVGAAGGGGSSPPRGAAAAAAMAATTPAALTPAPPRDRSPFFSPPQGSGPPPPPTPISSPPGARTVVSSTISVAGPPPSRTTSSVAVGVAVGLLLTVGVGVGLTAALRTSTPQKNAVDLGALAVPSSSPLEPPPPAVPPLPTDPPPSAGDPPPADLPGAAAPPPPAPAPAPAPAPTPTQKPAKPKARPAGTAPAPTGTSSGPVDLLNRGRF